MSGPKAKAFISEFIGFRHHVGQGSHLQEIWDWLATIHNSEEMPDSVAAGELHEFEKHLERVVELCPAPSVKKALTELRSNAHEASYSEAWLFDVLQGCKRVSELWRRHVRKKATEVFGIWGARFFEIAEKGLDDGALLQMAENTPMVPHWDQGNRRLVIGGEEVRQFAKQATAVSKILETFQQKGWPEKIHSPFDDDDGAGGKTNRAVASLNKLLPDGYLGFETEDDYNVIRWKTLQTDLELTL